MRGFGRSGAGLLVFVGLGLAAGCGPSRGIVPVEGRITFGGQPPPAPGYIYFAPLDMKAEETGSEPRLATAIFMQDGGFRPTTFRDGDGLRPGTYEARVECNANSGGGHGPARSAVPDGFKSPTIDIPASGSTPVRISIDVK